MSKQLNENEIANRFPLYLQELGNIHAATELRLTSCMNEGASDNDIEGIIDSVIGPETTIRFADRYSMLDNVYDYDPDEDDSLNEIRTALADLLVRPYRPHELPIMKGQGSFLGFQTKAGSLLGQMFQRT